MTVMLRRTTYVRGTAGLVDWSHHGTPGFTTRSPAAPGPPAGGAAAGPHRVLLPGPDGRRGRRPARPARRGDQAAAPAGRPRPRLHARPPHRRRPAGHRTPSLRHGAGIGP